MTKSDLIERLTKEMGKPLNQVTDTVEALFERMKDALKQDDRIEIRGFGSFGNRVYGEYRGRNPKTGALVVVKAKRVPFFKTARDLKNSIYETGSSLQRISKFERK